MDAHKQDMGFSFLDSVKANTMCKDCMTMESFADRLPSILFALACLSWNNVQLSAMCYFPTCFGSFWAHKTARKCSRLETRATSGTQLTTIDEK